MERIPKWMCKVDRVIKESRLWADQGAHGGSPLTSPKKCVFAQYPPPGPQDGPLGQTLNRLSQLPQLSQLSPKTRGPGLPLLLQSIPIRSPRSDAGA